MSPQLQQSFSEILNLLVESAKLAGVQAQGQLPLLVRDMLRGGVICCLGWFVLLGGLGMAGLWAGYQWRTHDDGTGLGTACGWLMQVGAVIVLACGICFNVFTIIEIYLAPRLYLLEQVKELVR